MPTYSYCGLTLASGIAISELPSANHDKPELLFRLEGAKLQRTDHPWSHHWVSAAGEQLLSYSKESSYHWLQFPGLADFEVSSDAREITCYSAPETPQETVRHLLLDQVLPRCLAYQGKIMLHASAAGSERGLMLFLGDSGAGKSTLAGNFHQAGNPAVSDDCLWVKEEGDQIVAVPSYGGLRLWDDSLEILFSPGQDFHSMAHYSSKKRVPLNRNPILGSGNGIPILAVIVLSPLGQPPVSEVTLERLSHREAFIAMLRQTFQLDITDLERMTRHVQVLGHIAPRLPSFRLSMPHQYDLLPLVRQKILEAVL